MRRDIMKVVFGDESAGTLSNGAAAAARDVRLQAWLECDAEAAEEIVVYLRRLNKSESQYDQFWKVMATFLEEQEMKVDARCHGTTCEVPIAWSVRSLVREIREYAASPAAYNQKFQPLSDDQVPSDQWVRMGTRDNHTAYPHTP